MSEGKLRRAEESYKREREVMDQAAEVHAKVPTHPSEHYRVHHVTPTLSYAISYILSFSHTPSHSYDIDTLARIHTHLTR